VTGIDSRAIKALEDYSWPGNVRQLRNIVEKMVVLSSGGKLTLEDIPVEILQGEETVAAENTDAAPTPTQSLSLADAERTKILSVLASVGGNKTKAAEMLGISRRTIQRKMNEWNVQ